MAEQQKSIISQQHKTPAHRYSSYSAGIYSLCSTLFDAATAQTIMHVFGSKLQKSGQSTYDRHDKLHVYKIAVDSINEYGPKKSLVPHLTSVHEAIPLILRDQQSFTIEEIAAITGLAEGSTRLRIEKSRYKFTNIKEVPPIRAGHHHCIVDKEYLEDGLINVTATNCPSCLAFQKAKQASVEKFSSSQHSIPEDLLTIPVAPVLVKEGNRTLLNWSAAPWYVRVLTEGFLATALVMGVVLSAPKIKSVYELWLEKRIDLSGLTELATSVNSSEEAASPVPTPVEPSTPDPEAATLPAEQTAANKKSMTTVTSVFTENDGAAAASHKIYRIMIKTDSPDSLKESINGFMAQIKAETQRQQTSYGVDLPGGVLFDVYIPVKTYKGLLNELGKYGEMKVIITQSHQKAIPGKARIKIWLQRI